MPTSKEKTKIEVGQWVYLPVGKSRLKALVVEDHGLIGYNRERFFLVLVPDSEDMVEYTQAIAQSELTPA
jgi:hypothetical protein